MQPRKFCTLSAITAGSLTLAAVAITASSGTSQTATHAALAARTQSFLLLNSTGTPPGQLSPGQQITSGTQIASPDGKFVLQMQSDGNLVLRAPGNIPLGDTHTAGHDGTIAVMQTDGNFVLRAPGNIPVWASGTDGHSGTVLQVQDDGGVVLYAPGHQVLHVIFPASPDPRNSGSTPTVPPATVPAPAEAAADPDPLNPADWSPGDVHVHSLGDASLRDNLDCRDNVPGFPTGHAATKDQEQACATYLVNKVLTTAKSHGLKWVILSEHGVWMGIYAPGADASALSYSRSEAAGEWQTVRDTASAAAPTAGVRALIGEEIGSAPPLTTSGHFSTYYSSDYVANDQYDNSEGKFLQKVKTAGAWGAINHPGTGSTWGCWYTTDCPDGVASSFPGQVKAVEVYTANVKPIGDVLTRWDGLLDRGLKVAAVGGGDTHTVKRCNVDPWPPAHIVTGDCPIWRTLQQQIGNTDALGTDGRARTYVLAENITPGGGYNSNDAADPVRTALASGTTLASNGPVAGVAIDGKAPTSASYLPYSGSGHTVQITWDPAQAKAVNSGGISSGTYGPPTSIKLVIGQIVDNTYRGDCGHASDPFRHSDCVHAVDVPLDTVTHSGNLDKITYQLNASDFKTFTLPGPGSGFSTQYTPTAFVRVEINFADGRGVYSSPFYIQGTATQIPNF
jgi:hypothetical protein